MKKTQGVILRRHEIRETSLILIAFTEDLGKIQGLVKGVRGVGPAVPWYLEPMTLQAMVLYERKRSPVALISACDLIDPFDPIRRDLLRTAYGIYALELVDRMTELSDPHPEIFKLLLACLRSLADHGDPKSLVRFLEVHLIRVSGLLPDPKSFSLSPGAQLSLQRILESPFERCGKLRLSHAVEKELSQLTGALLKEVLERPLNSRAFLQSLGLDSPLL